MKYQIQNAEDTVLILILLDLMLPQLMAPDDAKAEISRFLISLIYGDSKNQRSIRSSPGEIGADDAPAVRSTEVARVKTILRCKPARVAATGCWPGPISAVFQASWRQIADLTPAEFCR